MRKVRAAPPPSPPAPPEQKPAPPAPMVDVERVLERHAAAAAEQSAALVSAVRDEMRTLTAALVQSRKGRIRVDIERGRDGYMKTLFVEREGRK